MSEPRKRRSTGNVTLADVAKQAGVGTMTVSRALRTPELVSDKLREKFNKWLMSSAISRTKPQGHSHLQKVIPSLLSFRHCLKSMRAFLTKLQQALNKAGYQLLLGYSDYSIEQEEKLLSTF